MCVLAAPKGVYRAIDGEVVGIPRPPSTPGTFMPAFDRGLSRATLRIIRLVRRVPDDRIRRDRMGTARLPVSITIP
jgi:hypothetical protein